MKTRVCAIGFAIAISLSSVAHGFPLLSRASPELLVQWENGLTSEQKASYESLKIASKAYFEQRAAFEDVNSGSDHPSSAARMLSGMDSRFSDEVWNFNQQHPTWPLATPEAAAEADARLNATYRRLLGLLTNIETSHRLFELHVASLKKTQRLWITYRDAWLHFEDAVWGKLSPHEGIAAYLSDQRMDELRTFERSAADLSAQPAP